ncbi:MAG: BamA/TamA family outer membrane protein [Candidatus Cloacimonadales bacterium]
MKKNKLLLLALIIFSLGALAAEDNLVLKEIQFSGNEAISARRLSSNLTLEAKWLKHKILFWRPAPTFSEFLLQEDLKQIRVDYQKQGFLQVEVAARKDIDKSQQEISLTFEIKENEPVTITEIVYDISAETQSKAAKLRDSLADAAQIPQLQVGEKFEDNQLKNTQTRFFHFLQENGYPFPEVDFSIELAANQKQAKLIYQIVTGDFCEIGEISVLGNEQTPAEPILQQASIDSGQIFVQSELEKSQKYIQQLGMFQSVTLRNKLVDIENNKIPIEILVQELPFWSLKTGVGYGLEDRFRISAELQKLGFLGGIRRANFYAKHSFLEPYHFSLKFTQPAPFNRRSTLSANNFIKKENEIAYELQRYGLIFTLQQGFGKHSSTFANYKFERNNLQIKEEEATEMDDEYYNKSSIAWGISRDSSTPAFFPDQGFYTSLVTTLSGLKLRSKYHYTQIFAEIRNFQRLSGFTVLATRAKYGIIKPIWGDEITPVEELFVAGGSSSIRGWSRASIGPKNEFDNTIGGESYLEFSCELRQRIYRKFYLVAFTDLGNVWQRYDQHNLQDLLYAAGLGLRLDTPIGPLRIDAAQPLWNQQKKIQIHLSIGQAF